VLWSWRPAPSNPRVSRLSLFQLRSCGRNLMAHLRKQHHLRIRAPCSEHFHHSLPPLRCWCADRLHRDDIICKVTAAAVDSPDSESTMWSGRNRISTSSTSCSPRKTSASNNHVPRHWGDGRRQKRHQYKIQQRSWLEPESLRSDEFGKRRAFVNLVTTPQALTLWSTMDQARDPNSPKLWPVLRRTSNILRQRVARRPASSGQGPRWTGHNPITKREPCGWRQPGQFHPESRWAVSPHPKRVRCRTRRRSRHWVRQTPL